MDIKFIEKVIAVQILYMPKMELTNFFILSLPCFFEYVNRGGGKTATIIHTYK